MKADVKDPDLVEHARTTGGFPSTVHTQMFEIVNDHAKEELYLKDKIGLD